MKRRKIKMNVRKDRLSSERISSRSREANTRCPIDSILPVAYRYLINNYDIYSLIRDEDSIEILKHVESRLLRDGKKRSGGRHSFIIITPLHVAHVANQGYRQGTTARTYPLETPC